MKLRYIFIVLFIGLAGRVAAQDPRFSMSPNPAHNQVTISLSGNQTQSLNIELFTVLGQRVYSQQAMPEQGSVMLNTSGLPEGVYLVKVSSAGQTFVKRLKIQHQ